MAISATASLAEFVSNVRELSAVVGGPDAQLRCAST
ncbi:hypothetical protein R69749_07122 [Paraburkholderia domus]|jgi:hypothetical protein|nr:hypothetical protein R70006_04803 [Paraburkholderia domus]CAE6794022.1 hypothetical protein R75483_05025 [Paraburkholderia domus]CAE6882498.1 hypothetical protein R69749_07122 [Paraburkholderia domus]